MIFGVYDMVLSKGGEGDGADAGSKSSGARSRYIVSIHHTRDSADKQWVATQALVLRGLCRVLRSFFSDLLETTDKGGGKSKRGDETPWFEKAWNKILGYAFEASTQLGGRSTLDLRNVGVELLVVCNQLACNAGIRAAITPARVSTDMEVVNGALRSVRTPPEKKNSPRRSHSEVTEMWRENMFLDAFDVLDSFREHLEGDAADFNESGLTLYMESTQVQVLAKFAGELSKLYDCCKDDEFLEDKSFDKLVSFDKPLATRTSDAGEEDAFVTRFVRLVVKVATETTSGPDARFPSQAQRSAIDLLRSMASNGSPEAFLNLTALAGSTIFR
jgi:hypothetical protein